MIGFLERWWRRLAMIAAAVIGWALWSRLRAARRAARRRLRAYEATRKRIDRGPSDGIGAMDDGSYLRRAAERLR